MILTLSTLITDFLSEPLENILEQISFMFLASLLFPPLLLLLFLMTALDKRGKVGATPADFFYAFLWLAAITLIIIATVMVTMLLANLGPIAPAAIIIFFAADFACYKGYKTYKAYQLENRLPTSERTGAPVLQRQSLGLGTVNRINDTKTSDNLSSNPDQDTSSATRTSLHTRG